MKLRLTTQEISEYNETRRKIMCAMTSAEVAEYTRKCHEILRKGERRYTAKLSTED
jgi:hypothetical protein